MPQIAARRHESWELAKRKKAPAFAGADAEFSKKSISLEACAFKDLGSNAVNHGWDRRMRNAFYQENGDRGFGRVVLADRDTHALSSGLTHEIGNVGFFCRSCAVYFDLADCGLHSAGVIKDHPRAHTIDHRWNLDAEIPGRFDDQSAFARIVSTGADGKALDRCILHQDSGVALDCGNALVFFRGNWNRGSKSACRPVT